MQILRPSTAQSMRLSAIGFEKINDPGVYTRIKNDDLIKVKNMQDGADLKKPKKIGF